ncbi:MAG TPA: biotin transporter BioY [Desulfobacteraceae bacterium]|nr:biotin transporter BioY [Desulfobacteraceae bacterium]
MNTLTTSSSNATTPIRGMVYASMFGAATAAGAYIIIPVPPVPVTMQTLFLSLAGVLLGARLAAMSQIVYVLIGAMGLPVFAGGKAGLGILIGPTGGYLVGFIAGAYVIGKLAQLRPSGGIAWIFSAMAAGTFVIYLLGVAQLSVVAQLSIPKAAAVGALPFLPGDAVKIALAAFVWRKLRPHLDIRGSR